MNIVKLNLGEINLVGGGEGASVNVTNSTETTDVINNQTIKWSSVGNVLGMVAGVFYGVYKTQKYWGGVKTQFLDRRVLSMGVATYAAVCIGSYLAAVIAGRS